MVGTLLSVVFYFIFMAGSAENGTLSGAEIVVGMDKLVGEQVDVNKKESDDLGFVPGAGLPAIPGSLVKRIKNGDFVEFGELLPEFIGEAFLTKQGGKSTRKPPIVDKLPDWLLAFSSLAAVLVNDNKSLAAQLIGYQASIIRLYRDYPGKAWLAYDRAFRQKMAASQKGDWGQIDHDLWALALGPQRSSLPQQRFLSSSGSARRPFLSCDAWNMHRCLKPYCPFPHVCTACGRPGHRVQACSEAGSGGSSWRANHMVPGGSSWGNSGIQSHSQQLPVRGFPQRR